MSIIDLAKYKESPASRKSKLIARQKSLAIALAESVVIFTSLLHKYITPTSPEEDRVYLLEAANATFISIARGYGWSPDKGQYALLIGAKIEVEKLPDGAGKMVFDFAFQGSLTEAVLTIVKSMNKDQANVEVTPEFPPLKGA